MANLAFRSLMIHRCDIQQVGTTPASSQSYGHVTRSEEIVEQTYADVVCRLTTPGFRERASLSDANMLFGMFQLFVAWEDLPPAMRQIDGSQTFQIVNIRDRDGESLGVGPFDIRQISNAAGESHHAEMDIQAPA